jgi:uncharacterized protein
LVLLYLIIAWPTLSPKINDWDSDGISDSEDIIQGAVFEINKEVQYSTEYNRICFLNSAEQDTLVYPNGDINPQYGVCTDLIIRAFRNAGFDLQSLIHQDATQNPKLYPKIEKPNQYLDHRRVDNLTSFFQNHAQILSLEIGPKYYSRWKPGDVVIIKLGKGKRDHIALVSDSLNGNNKPYFIHNDGITCYYDGFNDLDWQIVGHYRFGGVEMALIQNVYYLVPLRLPAVRLSNLSSLLSN